ncbi:lipopolysaccharide assembly LapA domain-containing protein [Micromonospora sp. NPDC049282]|uniref:LapA family protein n=1 Tax=Micromonospora sp. NPDC049282 TaxID=3364269 RepID=UPI003710AEF3
MLLGRRRFVMTAPRNSHVRIFPHDDHRGTDASRPVPPRPAVKRSRVGGLWVAAVVFAVVLLLLLVFVLQNGQRAEVSFLGAHGTLPMGVALLLAAVSGVLLVALPGTARIVQLRMLGHRRVRQEAGAPEHRATTRPATGVASFPLPPRPENQDG